MGLLKGFVLVILIFAPQSRLGCFLFTTSLLAETAVEYSSSDDDQYSGVAYSDSYAVQPSGKNAPYPAAPYPAAKAVYPAKTYGPPPAAPSYSYGTSASIAPAPAPAPAAASGPGPSASGPGPIGTGGPGPSGPGPIGPGGPGPSGPGPFGPGPFGPGPFGPGSFGPGPFGFGPGPFPLGPGLLPYPYGPFAFKKGMIHFLLTKFKIGFKYLEFLLAPIGTITALISVLNFLKIKVAPKLVTKLSELHAVAGHDAVEQAVAAARRYRRSLEDLNGLTQRALSAMDNMCAEKLVCQAGRGAASMVSVDSNWVNSTLGMLKRMESPNSLMSIFRQSLSNGITDCNVILCKDIQSSTHHSHPTNDLDTSTGDKKALFISDGVPNSSGESSLDGVKNVQSDRGDETSDSEKDLNPDESNDIKEEFRISPEDGGIGAGQEAEEEMEVQ